MMEHLVPALLLLGPAIEVLLYLVMFTCAADGAVHSSIISKESLQDLILPQDFILDTKVQSNKTYTMTLWTVTLTKGHRLLMT